MHRPWKSILPAARQLRNRPAKIALGLAALGCVVLAVARIGHVFSFIEPRQLVTSGAEEEALASIWRFGHAQPVYTDPHLIPFTASCFNWLFYAVYGSAVELVHLGGAWMPTVCRAVTLGFAVLGAFFFARILRTEGRARWPLALTLGTLAFFNPLCGFWIVTTRPDVGATVFELGALTLFLRCQRLGGSGNLLVVALLLACAWSFKQTALGVLAGIVIAMVLLTRRERSRRRRARGLGRAGLLVLALIFAALVPCLLLGPLYCYSLYQLQLHSGFDPSWALLHFGTAAMKMPFIVIALAGAVLTWRHADDSLRTTGLVLAATFILELVMSAKGGAGDYYFLSLGVWSLLWIGLALARFESRRFNLAIGAAALVELAAVASVGMGRYGVVDPGDRAKPYAHLAGYLANRLGPVFVRDTYGDLPWISPTSPHFVVAYNDETAVQAGETFEQGGWQGLIEQGYFTTVVTRSAHPQISDAMLARYHFVREESGFRYYERN